MNRKTLVPANVFSVGNFMNDSFVSTLWPSFPLNRLCRQKELVSFFVLKPFGFVVIMLLDLTAGKPFGIGHLTCIGLRRNANWSTDEGSPMWEISHLECRAPMERRLALPARAGTLTAASIVRYMTTVR